MDQQENLQEQTSEEKEFVPSPTNSSGSIMHVDGTSKETQLRRSTKENIPQRCFNIKGEALIATPQYG